MRKENCRELLDCHFTTSTRRSIKTMQLPEVQSLGTDSEMCISTRGFFKPKKSSGGKRDQHWINLWEVLTLPSSMVFQDGIAAADIHDISGHRKFIRGKKMQPLCTHLETSEILHAWRTTAKQLLIFIKLAFPSFPL